MNPAQKARQRAESRRPIDAREVPQLEALGVAVEALRLQTGLTKVALAEMAGVGRRQVERIERGTRRTRLSTLDRFAEAFCEIQPSLGDPARLAIRLATVSGIALAPESEHLRTERRRLARVEQRQQEEYKTLLQKAHARTAAEMGARLELDEKLRCERAFREGANWK